MVSATFNFSGYKSAFGNRPQKGTDRGVSHKTDNDLALNTMMDHGIENQAVSNMVQARDPLTVMKSLLQKFENDFFGHIIWTILYGPIYGSNGMDYMISRISHAFIKKSI